MFWIRRLGLKKVIRVESQGVENQNGRLFLNWQKGGSVPRCCKTGSDVVALPDGGNFQTVQLCEVFPAREVQGTRQQAFERPKAAGVSREFGDSSSKGDRKPVSLEKTATMKHFSTILRCHWWSLGEATRQYFFWITGMTSPSQRIRISVGNKRFLTPDQK